MTDLSAPFPAAPVVLNEDDDGTLQAPPVLDNVGAERLMRRLRAEHQELATIAHQAQAWEDDIAAWRSDREAAPKRAIEALKRSLLAYAAALDADDFTRKSWPLPSGTLMATGGLSKDPKHRGEAVGAGALVVDRPALFVEWCLVEGHLDLLRIDPAVAVLKALASDEVERTDDAAVFRLQTADGEVVPGVSIVKSIIPSYKVTPKP